MTDVPESAWDGVPRMKAERDALAADLDEAREQNRLLALQNLDLMEQKRQWQDEREHMIEHMRMLARPRR